MTIQSDKVKAAAILKEIKGCKVEDSGNSFWATFQTYTVVDVKCFNGKVDLIGLKDENNVVKYVGAERYNEMASIA